MNVVVRVQVAIFVAISQFIGGVLAATIAGVLPWFAGFPKAAFAVGLVAGAHSAARLAPKIWRAAGQCSAGLIAIAGPTGFLLAGISTLKTRGILEPDEFIEAGLVLFSSFVFAFLGTLRWRRQVSVVMILDGAWITLRDGRGVQLATAFPFPFRRVSV
jgi:hypothetical protein